jgi:hypothetical protein
MDEELNDLINIKVESELEAAIGDYVEIMRNVFGENNINDEIIRNKFLEHINKMRAKADKTDVEDLMHEFGTAFFAAVNFDIEAGVFLQRAVSTIGKLKQAKKQTTRGLH